MARSLTAAVLLGFLLACGSAFGPPLGRTLFTADDTLVLYREQSDSVVQFWSDGTSQPTHTGQLQVPVQFQGHTWHPYRIGRVHVTRDAARFCGAWYAPGRPGEHQLCATVHPDCTTTLDFDDGPWPGTHAGDPAADLLLTTQGRLLKRAQSRTGTPPIWALHDGSTWQPLDLQPTPDWLDESATHWIGTVAVNMADGQPTAWDASGRLVEQLPPIPTVHKRRVNPSPTGSDVLVATNAAIEKWTPGTPPVPLLTPIPDPDGTPERFAAAVAWSPDGDSAVFWSNRDEGFREDWCTGIHHPVQQPFAIDVRSGVIEKLYETAWHPDASLWGPAWLAECAEPWTL